jgi:hypothetical protein
MDDWWVFGGFVAGLDAPGDRLAAEALLCCACATDTPGSVTFDRLCTALEAYALPVWLRTIGADGAAALAHINPHQTGARLAALAALAEPLGWDVGCDTWATGLSAMTTTWHFGAVAGGERPSINVRAGCPWLTERPGSAEERAIDIDFVLTPDEPVEHALRSVIAQLIRETERAASSSVLVDFMLPGRLDALRRI